MDSYSRVTQKPTELNFTEMDQYPPFSDYDYGYSNALLDIEFPFINVSDQAF